MEVKVLSRDIEKALRNLKKKLEIDGVFGEMKKRRFYEKPSVKKKRMKLEAQKRKRKLHKRTRPAGTAPRPGSGNAAHPARRTTTPEAGGIK